VRRSDRPQAVRGEGEGDPISIANFLNVLQDHVQVRLDFARLNDADFRVRACVLRDPMALIGWVSPWYVDADGNECDCDDAGAAPIPLVHPDGSPISAPPSRTQKVTSIANSMSMVRPGPLLIGGYKPVGRDLVVVLDGNHRLRGSLANGGSLHVMALILHGPNDPAILADLAAV